MIDFFITKISLTWTSSRWHCFNVDFIVYLFTVKPRFACRFTWCVLFEYF